LASVHAALSSRQRWRISARAQRGQLSLNAGNDDLLPADSENTPRRTAEAVQELAVLRSALSRLSPRKRLVLRLRYEQELSLKEVARVAGLGDLHQARRLIQAALGELQAHLADSGISN
jgi:RNA polymerase sigma factor (sigma-70 family)